MRLVAAASLFAVAIAMPAWAQPAGTWSQKAALPEPRAEVAAAALGGEVYVVGGGTKGVDASTLVEEYDPATNRWRSRAPLPRGLSHAGVAVMDGKLYAVGGFTANVHAGALDVAYEYDPAKDAWHAIAPMLTPLGSVGLASLDGKLYAVGGRGIDKVTVALNQAWDPATNQWSLRAPLPTARDHLGLIAVAGKLHAIAGRLAGAADNVGSHDVYDPATNAWTSAPPLPTPRSSVAIAFYRGLILVDGGECDHGHTFTQNEGFDVAKGIWRTLAPMAPKGRHGFRAATLGDAVYFPGGAAGCGGGDVSDTMLVFTLP